MAIDVTPGRTTVRRALPADAAALAEVAAVTFVLACPPSTTQESIDDFIATSLSEAAFEAYLADPARTLLVAASVPGEPLEGYTMLVAGEPYDADVSAALRIRPTAELSKIYVREGAHGRGTAGELLDRTLEAARGRRCGRRLAGHERGEPARPALLRQARLRADRHEALQARRPLRARPGLRARPLTAFPDPGIPRR